MKRRRFAAALSALALASVAACTTFGSGDPGPVEADAASSDSFADGFGSDAQRADGASGDAASDAFSCDASHAICDDFDTAALGARWTSSHIDRGSAALVADASVSAPQSLGVTLDATGASAALIKELAVRPTRIHCALQALVDGETVEVLHFEFAGEKGASNQTAEVRLGKRSFVVLTNTYVDGGYDYQQVDAPGVVLGAWTPLTVDLVPSAGGPQIVVTVNDGMSGPPVTHPSPAPSGAMLTRITLGAEYVLAPSRAFFDNVVCDVTP